MINKIILLNSNQFPGHPIATLHYHPLANTLRRRRKQQCVTLFIPVQVYLCVCVHVLENRNCARRPHQKGKIHQAPGLKFRC